MTRILAWIAAVAVTGFLVAVAIGPILTAHGLIAAARRGDEAGIERRVDFPALRDSLKSELEDEVSRRVRDDPRLADRGLGGIGAMLAPMILSGAVDTLVTPQVVARMVASGQAPDPAGARDEPAIPAVEDEDDHLHQSWGYRDLNQFAVTLTPRDRPDEHLALIMERRGLFVWKLAAVDIQSRPALSEGS